MGFPEACEGDINLLPPAAEPDTVLPMGAHAVQATVVAITTNAFLVRKSIFTCFSFDARPMVEPFCLVQTVVTLVAVEKEMSHKVRIVFL